MAPSSSCWRNVPKSVGRAESEFEISLEAKNASTITIRIGNAALLKKRLISGLRRLHGDGSRAKARESRLARGFGRPATLNAPAHTTSGALRNRHAGGWSAAT